MALQLPWARRYIELLRGPGGISERIWEEVRGLSQLHFDTRDKARPLSYTTSLASCLQLYPPKDLLPAMYGVPRVFAPDAIREALQRMTPEAVRVFWISKTHEQAEGEAAAPKAEGEVAEGREEGEQVAPSSGGRGVESPAGAEAAVKAVGAVGALCTEPWYGTRYGVGPLPADWLAAWAAARPEEEPRLHLPTPNPFIPTDLSLASDEAAAAPAQPVLVLAVPGRLRLWHKPDTRFGQPKAVLYLDVQSPEAYSSPRAAVMTRLFVKLMLDYLNEMAYPAQQAGLGYNIVNTQSGWQLLLSGYNHKLPDLMAEVMGRLAEFKAWQLSAALSEAAASEAARAEGGAAASQSESALRSEIASLVTRAASLERQLTEAVRQYDNDLLAAEQLAVAARESALAAAQGEFQERSAQAAAAYAVQLAEAEGRVAAAAEALRAAEVRAAEGRTATEAEAEAAMRALRQELQAARADASSRLEAVRAEVEAQRSQLSAAVAEAAAELADTRQRFSTVDARNAGQAVLLRRLEEVVHVHVDHFSKPSKQRCPALCASTVLTLPPTMSIACAFLARLGSASLPRASIAAPTRDLLEDGRGGCNLSSVAFVAAAVRGARGCPPPPADGGGALGGRLSPKGAAGFFVISCAHNIG
ncbi:Zinc-metallopeptidase, peroxisomal [Tetrabaena socialis]|uniref:Zinc-metallopeptidase, peroxisomal n=1 Tax=Tetrabaena socialis TaxID=47790 RepID=A0A2J8A2H4_9CHLO|nr:Zinc-metallopeptidase, peroxisomal [Tetrabaena socialis]|eukprot:PNH06715.1 Zinc-metallopeptidase, peroxisomal [Tetrabaena socialis]